MATKFGLAIVILSVFTLFGFNASRPGSQPGFQDSPKPGMFKIVILYPNGDGKTFDMDYYEKKHMPMVAGFIGKNLVFYEIDKGVAGRSANEKTPYMAMGYFYVRDTAAYNKSIAENRVAVINDFKNYTNVQPVVQINEIRQVVHTGENLKK